MSRIHQTFESWMRIVLGMALLSLALPVMGASGTPFRLATRFVDIQPLQLDAPERQWLANHGTLRVGIAIGDYEPVDITDDRNNYQGISADYLSIVRDTLGVPVEVLGYRRRDQAVAELLAGNIDILASASGFERGIEGVAFSREYMTDRLVIVCRSCEEEPVKNWVGKKSALWRATSIFIPPRRFTLTVKSPPSVTCIMQWTRWLRGISTGLSAMNLSCSHSKVSGLIRGCALSVIAPCHPPVLHLLHASDPELGLLINRALGSLDDNTSRMVLSRWIIGLEGHAVQSHINLLPGELEWIQRNPVVALATQQFPLYAFKTGDGRWVGLSVDILARISRMTGLQFVHKEAFSTVQILDMLKSGEALMNSSLSRSRERKAF